MNGSTDLEQIKDVIDLVIEFCAGAESLLAQGITGDELTDDEFTEGAGELQRYVIPQYLEARRKYFIEIEILNIIVNKEQP